MRCLGKSHGAARAVQHSGLPSLLCPGVSSAHVHSSKASLCCPTPLPPRSFLRVSKRMIEKMGQNASYMGLTVRRSWQQLLRELNSNNNKDH